MLFCVFKASFWHFRQPRHNRYSATKMRHVLLRFTVCLFASPPSSFAWSRQEKNGAVPPRPLHAGLHSFELRSLSTKKTKKPPARRQTKTRRRRHDGDTQNEGTRFHPTSVARCDLHLVDVRDAVGTWPGNKRTQRAANEQRCVPDAATPCWA